MIVSTDNETKKYVGKVFIAAKDIECFKWTDKENYKTQDCIIQKHTAIKVISSEDSYLDIQDADGNTATLNNPIIHNFSKFFVEVDRLSSFEWLSLKLTSPKLLAQVRKLSR